MVKEGLVDFGEKSITGSRTAKFQLETDQVARVSVLSKNAFMVMDHYSDKTRRHGRCIREIEACPACASLGEPKQRFGVLLLVYKTDSTGQLVKPSGVSIVPWIFGPDKFVDLRNLKQQWGVLSKLDLLITCKDKQFQKFTIVPGPKCLWRSKETIQAKVLKMVKESKIDLETILGKYLPGPELSKLLGLEIAGQSFDETDLDEGDLGGSLEEGSLGDDPLEDAELADSGNVADQDLSDIDAALDDL